MLHKRVISCAKFRKRAGLCGAAVSTRGHWKRDPLARKFP